MGKGRKGRGGIVWEEERERGDILRTKCILRNLLFVIKFVATIFAVTSFVGHKTKSPNSQNT